MGCQGSGHFSRLSKASCFRISFKNKPPFEALELCGLVWTLWGQCMREHYKSHPWKKRRHFNLQIKRSISFPIKHHQAFWILFVRSMRPQLLQRNHSIQDKAMPQLSPYSQKQARHATSRDRVDSVISPFPGEWDDAMENWTTDVLTDEQLGEKCLKNNCRAVCGEELGHLIRVIWWFKLLWNKMRSSRRSIGHKMN